MKEVFINKHKRGNSIYFYIRKGGVPEGRAPSVLHYSMPHSGIWNLGSPRKIDFQNKFKHRNQNNISI